MFFSLCFSEAANLCPGSNPHPILDGLLCCSLGTRVTNPAHPNAREDPAYVCPLEHITICPHISRDGVCMNAGTTWPVDQSCHWKVQFHAIRAVISNFSWWILFSFLNRRSIFHFLIDCPLFCLARLGNCPSSNPWPHANGYYCCSDYLKYTDPLGSCPDATNTPCPEFTNKQTCAFKGTQ